MNKSRIFQPFLLVLLTASTIVLVTAGNTQNKTDWNSHDRIPRAADSSHRALLSCGDGVRGDGVCTDGRSCSQSGWCGSSPAHCSGGEDPLAGLGIPPSVGSCGIHGETCATGTCCDPFDQCSRLACGVDSTPEQSNPKNLDWLWRAVIILFVAGLFASCRSCNNACRQKKVIPQHSGSGEEQEHDIENTTSQNNTKVDK